MRIHEAYASDTYMLRDVMLSWATVGIPEDAVAGVKHLVITAPSGLVVACASCGPLACPDPEWAGRPAWRFWGVATLARYQGRGYAAALLERVLDEARHAGAAVAWANARESAVSFYLEHGFTASAETFPDALNGRLDRRVMLALVE